MPPPADSPDRPPGSRLLFYLMAAVGLLLPYALLSLFDDKTELTPAHPFADQALFWIAGIAALLYAALAFHESRGLKVWQRAYIPLIFAFEAFLCVFLLSFRTIDLVENHLDFPPSQTLTFPGYLRLWRAYHTSGKGDHWYIQTTPLWSDLEITRTDYNFMLAHRAPGDPARSPDEIPSHGFLCAHLTLQRGPHDALRILHAGILTLPTGSVGLCPTSAPAQ